ncbi:unnamed protein product [Moneuplotes crassus]|uniref:Uncharacterized protein n=1 Tax=Euplotes crassus TaxID=5936 RepID=A0AAD1X582_EUPCR|nr:unnamed protein product [Moneuplotes crassus]
MDSKVPILHNIGFKSVPCAYAYLLSLTRGLGVVTRRKAKEFFPKDLKHSTLRKLRFRKFKILGRTSLSRESSTDQVPQHLRRNSELSLPKIKKHYKSQGSLKPKILRRSEDLHRKQQKESKLEFKRRIHNIYGHIRNGGIAGKSCLVPRRLLEEDQHPKSGNFRDEEGLRNKFVVVSSLKLPAFKSQEYNKPQTKTSLENSCSKSNFKSNKNDQNKIKNTSKSKSKNQSKRHPSVVTNRPPKSTNLTSQIPQRRIDNTTPGKNTKTVRNIKKIPSKMNDRYSSIQAKKKLTKPGDRLNSTSAQIKNKSVQRGYKKDLGTKMGPQSQRGINYVRFNKHYVIPSQSSSNPVEYRTPKQKTSVRLPVVSKVRTRNKISIEKMFSEIINDTYLLGNSPAQRYPRRDKTDSKGILKPKFGLFNTKSINKQLNREATKVKFDL